MAIRIGIASFCGGRGLAIVDNGTWRNVLHVGVIAVIGNEVHLLLHDRGVPPVSQRHVLSVSRNG